MSDILSSAVFFVSEDRYLSGRGPKIAENVTTHRDGRWRGRRPRARHGGAREVGSGEGRGSPSPV